MNTRGLGDDTAVRNMLDAQERIFRLAAADSLDPTTGRASPPTSGRTPTIASTSPTRGGRTSSPTIPRATA